MAFAAILLVIGSLSVGTGLGARDSVEPVIHGDTFLFGLEWPVAIDFAPDGRLFYAELLTGQIRVVKDGMLLPKPFYDFEDAVFFGERGLLGLVLDPDFPSQPWVYAYYTYQNASEGSDYNKIVRVSADGDVGTAVEVVLDPIPGATNHNGGVIRFGPDGMLYAVTGDVAAEANAQNLSTRAGKVLRMTSAGAVPPDNPFVGSPGVDPYVYTYGHRNQYGLTFHPETGRAYASENGPFCNDEVNLLVAGGNFGWGPSWSCSAPPDPPLNTNQDGPDPVRPIFWTAGVVAPTNLVAYEGAMFPSWSGDLIVGEWNTRNLRRLDLAGPDYDAVASTEVVHTAASGILDVAVRPDGSIWYTTPSAIYRLSNAAPTASFTISEGDPYAGRTILFDASGSSDDGPIESYDWDFGDGGTGSGVTVTHAFAATGFYTVTLTVTDDAGLNATDVLTVTVREPISPVASFSLLPSTPFVNETVVFDASASMGSDGLLVAFDWDFGDGTQASGVLVSHAYLQPGTFVVRLIVTDDLGLSSDATQTVRVVPRAMRPLAGFHVTPSNPAVGDVVSFAASLSFDPDGYVVAYLWDFGDGATGTGFSIEHAYGSAGTFDVMLTLEDNEGLTNVSHGPVDVNDPPIPAFTLSAAVSYVGVPVIFDASASADPDGSLVSFRWDFGDGTEASGTEVSHAYSAKGTFAVRLRVVDDGGAVRTTDTLLEIGNRGPSIVAKVPPGDPVRLVLGDSLVLSSLATDPDGDPVSYSWYVDDVLWVAGTSAVRFWVDTPGTHVVLVRASDGDLEAVAEWTIILEPALEPLASPWGAATLWIAAGVLAVTSVGLLIWFRGRANRRTPP